MPIIPRKIFLELKKSNPTLTLDSPINEHMKSIRRFYLSPYGSNFTIPIKKKIERDIHGVLHANRTASYIKPLVNFRKKYGDQEASRLIDEEIKVLQLLAGFHDSGRNDEGIDYWDQDSAFNFFLYATEVLGMDEAKAMRYAEVIANKDCPVFYGQEPIYHKLVKNTRGQIEWQTIRDCSALDEKQQILIKLLHDADCLDIKRTTCNFQPGYLFIYQEIARTNQSARDELGKIICDVFYLLNKQHDTIQWRRVAEYDGANTIKEEYELDEACYDLIEQDLKELKNQERRPLGELFDPIIPIAEETAHPSTSQATTSTSTSSTETSSTSSSIDYKKIVTEAQQNYLHGTKRYGFGAPPAGSNRILSEKDRGLINQISADEKTNKKAIIKYLNDQALTDLHKPFSFASYLLDNLRKNDTKNRGRWQYYISNPVVLYRQEYGVLYHGTIVAPKIIFGEGLIAQFPQSFQDCREKYIANFTDSTGVSTTYYPEIARGFAFRKTRSGIDDQYIYVIDYSEGRKGVDIDSTMRARGHQCEGIGEVNIGEIIPSGDIVGAYKIVDKNYWLFFPNQTYLKQKELSKADVEKKYGSSYFFPTRVDKQTAKLTISESIASERLKKIKQFIKHTTQEKKWTFSIGGTRYSISIDGTKYPVPHGIKKIWDIIDSKYYSSQSEKLLDIRVIAAKQKTQNTCFWFGQRQPATIFYYEKIRHLALGLDKSHYTAQKEATFT